MIKKAAASVLLLAFYTPGCLSASDSTELSVENISLVATTTHGPSASRAVPEKAVEKIEKKETETLLDSASTVSAGKSTESWGASKGNRPTEVPIEKEEEHGDDDVTVQNPDAVHDSDKSTEPKAWKKVIKKMFGKKAMEGKKKQEHIGNEPAQEESNRTLDLISNTDATPEQEPKEAEETNENDPPLNEDTEQGEEIQPNYRKLHISEDDVRVKRLELKSFYAITKNNENNIHKGVEEAVDIIERRCNNSEEILSLGNTSPNEPENSRNEDPVLLQQKIQNHIFQRQKALSEILNSILYSNQKTPLKSIILKCFTKTLLKYLPIVGYDKLDLYVLMSNPPEKKKKKEPEAPQPARRKSLLNKKKLKVWRKKEKPDTEPEEKETRLVVLNLLDLSEILLERSRRRDSKSKLSSFLPDLFRFLFWIADLAVENDNPTGFLENSDSVLYLLLDLYITAIRFPIPCMTENGLAKGIEVLKKEIWNTLVSEKKRIAYLNNKTLPETPKTTHPLTLNLEDIVLKHIENFIAIYTQNLLRHLFLLKNSLEQRMLQRRNFMYDSTETYKAFVVPTSIFTMATKIFAEIVKQNSKPPTWLGDASANQYMICRDLILDERESIAKILQMQTYHLFLFGESLCDCIDYMFTSKKYLTTRKVPGVHNSAYFMLREGNHRIVMEIFPPSFQESIQMYKKLVDPNREIRKATDVLTNPLEKLDGYIGTGRILIEAQKNAIKIILLSQSSSDYLS